MFKKKLIALTLSACTLFTAFSAQAATLPVRSPRAISTVHSSWGASKMGFDAFAATIDVPANVTVAVIDTGVDTDHFLLEGRLSTGYDFGENKSVPEDVIGHGTYMCGIIADCTRNVPGIKIMPLKVSSADGTLTADAQCRAIDFAVEHGAKVISISFASEDLACDHSIDEVIDRATKKGVTVVVAAGNDKKDASLICPAHNPNALTISALDKSGRLADYSNFGDVIDFAAPGSYVCGASLNNETRVDSGTSVAAPHVAAAAAMIYAKYPAVSVSEVRSLLEKSCDPLGPSRLYGHGLINLSNLCK